MRNHRLLICLFVLALTACSRGDNAGSTVTTLSVSDPNSFAQFLNPQISLPVGTYTIVAATKTAAASGAYTLTVTDDNGTTQTYNGSWTSSGGQSPTASGNPTYPLSMTTAGGITISLNSGATDAYAYLLDSTGTVVAEDDNTGGGTNARIALPAPINSVAYAKAYYAMIDAGNNRDTLAKWQAQNDFSLGYDAHVVFHDVRDLGYGRNMYVRRTTVGGGNTAIGDVAAYVENFAVDAGPGTYSNSPLNLDAVVNNDRRWHIGTNAIEYSIGPSGQKIVKFYNFSPDGTRNLVVDLDGRGPKAMPGACIYCHGGRADPLQQNASGNWVFPRQGNVWGRMQGIEVDAVEFSTKPGFTRADQEAALKTINQRVLCTYPLSAASALPEDACRIAYTPGEWTGDSGAALIKSWYGGNNMPSATFIDSYLPPAGWTDGTVLANGAAGNVPAGSTNVYANVIATSCRACHILRGTDNQNDIDFNAYQTTLYSVPDMTFWMTGNEWGYTERIKAHVFDNGNMPLARLVYDAFWGSGNAPGSRPSLLANFLAPNAPAIDAGGNPLQPGRPIANAGPNNRTTTTPVRLSAIASQFANSYQWSIVSSPTAASLTNANTTNPTFDTPTHSGLEDGAYVLRLVASNGTTQSAPADITIHVQNTSASWGSVPLPKNIRFSDIRAILQSNFAGPVYGATNGAGCSGCHNPGGGYNMAVFYSDANRVGNSCVDSLVYEETGPCTDAQNMHQFYLDIRARINFSDPEDSLILRKPTGHHHGGGQVDGFGASTTDGMRYYNIFLEWIMNGAPEY